MCAIAGILEPGEVQVEHPRTTDRRRLRQEDLLRRMLESQRHRGPDGEGTHFDGPLALGHRRLSILDLSDSGRQPMSSGDGRWVVTLNGEIFNYRELRAELGGAFRSATDTEVLVEACSAWGVERTLERARGMFGFAVWDARERRLTLARDRVGEKPLVYFWDGRRFAFASELKALAPLHNGRLDAEAVDAYLALGYVPAPLAIFERCRKLEAGHRLDIEPGGGPLGVSRWWFPERVSRGAASRQADRATELRATELRETLGDAVRMRLHADVPVALYLSGGVDSSIIAAECVRQGSRLDAFTVSFDRDTTDLPFAQSVARKLGLRHEVLAASGDAFLSGYQRMAWHYDEPFADSSALPTFALAEATRGRFKVVLSGDGGDEAFGGYRHYERIAAKQAIKAAAAAVGLCDGRGTGRTGIYVQSKSTFRGEARSRLLNGHAPGESFGQLLTRQAFPPPEGSSLKRALWTDRHLQLANGLTFKTDIALGAFGMEGRAAFLDHTVLEWAQGLPSKDLVDGSAKKVLLRKAYAADLPQEVMDRTKHGFGAPIGRWLAGPLRKMAEECIPCPLLAMPVQIAAATEFARAGGGNASGQRLWTLVAFSLWARTWGARW